MHLEGSIEPGLMFKLTARNGISLRYRSEEELRSAYRFVSLQSFLDVYYAGLTGLLTERDFRMTSRLVIGIQRQWSQEDALATLEGASPYRDRIAGVGLGGPELPNPPKKFARAFERARALGWRTVAHAGEEGPAAYVAETVDVLEVDRVDHGVRCEEDPALVARLAEMQVPLTVGPVSNVKLRVFPDLASHNLKRLLDAGVRVTVNSDDPSYFLGYVNDNYAGCQEALELTREGLHVLARNSFTSAFLDDAEKVRYIATLDQSFARGATADGPLR